jgi:hypothetical protein
MGARQVYVGRLHGYLVRIHILFEYEEMMTRMLGSARWQKFVRFMD